MVDGCSIPVEDADILTLGKDVIDDLLPSLPIHAGRLFLSSAKRAKNGLGFSLVLDGANAVAAKLMLACESCRGEDNI